MSIKYVTTGKLVLPIASENIAEAQEFLTEDDMTRFMDESIAGVIKHIAWSLSAQDGQSYMVTAWAERDLTDDELRVLSEWTSGQNSDGLGESFEQQDFAWIGPDEDCGMCEGCEQGYTCDELENGAMASFDWQTNKSVFQKVVRD